MTEKYQSMFWHLSLSSSCKYLTSLYNFKNFLSGCCTLILTPFIIRQFENLCYESTFHADKPIAFAYGKAGDELTYLSAKTYCETCDGFESGGSCAGVAPGATGRLVDMSNEDDVNAVNEVLLSESHGLVTPISACYRSHATTLRRNLLGFN